MSLTDGLTNTLGKALHREQAASVPSRADQLASDPTVKTLISLTLDQVESRSEINPRRLLNPEYESIKENIRINGIENPVTVTRKPGNLKYWIIKGGNTRITAVRALWAETHDRKYFIHDFVFEPWEENASAIYKARMASLSENIKGDMAFIEHAEAYINTKNDLEQSEGKVFSFRDAAKKITALGHKIDAGTLSRYQSAVRLYPYLKYSFDELRIGKTFFEKILRLEKILMEYVKNILTTTDLSEFFSGWHHQLALADEAGELDVDKLQDEMELWLAEWLDQNHIEVVTDIEALFNKSRLGQTEDCFEQDAQSTPVRELQRPQNESVSSVQQAEKNAQAPETPPPKKQQNGAPASTTPHSESDVKSDITSNSVLTEHAISNSNETRHNTEIENREAQQPTIEKYMTIAEIRSELKLTLDDLLSDFPKVAQSLAYDEIDGPVMLEAKFSADPTELDIYLWWFLFCHVNMVMNDPDSVPLYAVIGSVFPSIDLFYQVVFKTPYFISGMPEPFKLKTDRVEQLLRAANQYDLATEQGEIA